MVELKDIKIAAERLKGIITYTPLIQSAHFSEEYRHDVYIKPENLQITGAFKIRGAYNMIASLDAETKERGLIASSAGNHAQGVALAAKLLSAKATIVMPKTTPLIKTEGTGN
jgi:threonine dehydratase